MSTVSPPIPVSDPAPAGATDAVAASPADADSASDAGSSAAPAKSTSKSKGASKGKTVPKGASKGGNKPKASDKGKGAAKAQSNPKGKGAAKALTAPKSSPGDPLSPFRRIATNLRTIGDPTRVAVVRLLGEGDMFVGQICEALAASQPAVSHHLALMRHCGVVEQRRDGKQCYYSLTDKGQELARVVEALC